MEEEEGGDGKLSSRYLWKGAGRSLRVVEEMRVIGIRTEGYGEGFVFIRV